MQAPITHTDPLTALNRFFDIVEANNVATSLQLLGAILADGANEPGLLHQWFFQQTQKSAFEAMLTAAKFEIDINNHDDPRHKNFHLKSYQVDDKSSFFEAALSKLIANATDAELTQLCNLFLNKFKYELFESVVKEAVKQNNLQKLTVIKDTLLASNTIHSSFGLLLSVLSVNELITTLQKLVNTPANRQTSIALFKNMASLDPRTILLPSIDRLKTFLYQDLAVNGTVNYDLFFNHGFNHVLHLLFASLDDDQRCELLRDDRCKLNANQIAYILNTNNNPNLSIRVLNAITVNWFKNNPSANPVRSQLLIDRLCSVYNANTWSQDNQNLFRAALSDPIGHLTAVARCKNVNTLCALLEQLTLLESTGKMYCQETMAVAVRWVIGSDSAITNRQYNGKTCYIVVPSDKNSVFEAVWPHIKSNMNRNQANFLIRVLYRAPAILDIKFKVTGKLIELIHAADVANIFAHLLNNAQPENIREVFKHCEQAGANIPQASAVSLVNFMTTQLPTNPAMKQAIYGDTAVLPVRALFANMNGAQQLAFINDADTVMSLGMAEALCPEDGHFPVALSDAVVRALFLKAVRAPNAEAIVKHLITSFTANQAAVNHFKKIFDEYVKDPQQGTACRALLFRSNMLLAYLPKLLVHYPILTTPELIITSLDVAGFDIEALLIKLDDYAQNNQGQLVGQKAERLLNMLYHSKELFPKLVEGNVFKNTVMILNRRDERAIQKIVDYLVILTVGTGQPHSELLDLLRTTLGECVVPIGGVTHHNQTNPTIASYILKRVYDADKKVIVKNGAELLMHVLSHGRFQRSTEMLEKLLNFGCRPALQGSPTELFWVAGNGILKELALLKPYVKQVEVNDLKQALFHGHQDMFYQLCALGVECNPEFFKNDEIVELVDIVANKIDVGPDDGGLQFSAERFVYLVDHGALVTSDQVDKFMTKSHQAFVAQQPNLLAALETKLPATALKYYMQRNDLAAVTRLAEHDVGKVLKYQLQRNDFAAVANLIEASTTEENMLDPAILQELAQHSDQIEPHSKKAAEYIRFYQPVTNDNNHTAEHQQAITDLQQRMKQQAQLKKTSLILGILLSWTIVVPIVLLVRYFKLRQDFHSMQLKTADYLKYKMRPEKDRTLFTLKHRAQTKELSYAKQVDGNDIVAKRKLVQQSTSDDTQVTLFFASKKQKDKFAFKLKQWEQKETLSQAPNEQPSEGKTIQV